MLRCHVRFFGNLHAFISQSGNNQIAFNVAGFSVVNAGLHRHGCRAITGIALSSTTQAGR